MKSCWAGIPLFSRWILITCSLITFISFFVPSIVYYLACVPILIVNNFYFWQFITGLLVHMGVLQLLFGLFSYMFTACEIEKEIGTVRMIYRFFVLGGICLVIFTIICALLGLNQVSQGLWCMVFCDMVYKCMKQPDQVRNLCCLPIRLE